LIILAKRKFDWSSAIRENAWVILLIGYMLASCLWSDISFLAFKRWTREVIAVIMAFVVSSERYPQAALESMLRRMVYILIPFSWLLINYFGEYGRIFVHHQGYLMWIGVTLHKNSLGQLCAFAALFLIWMIIKRLRGGDVSFPKYQIPLNAATLFLVFWLMGGPEHTFAYSATSTAALALGLLFYIFLSQKQKKSVIAKMKGLTVLTGCILIYGTVTPFIGGLTLVDVSALGREETLTGRTTVWAQVVPVAMKKPILGHGVGSFWTSATREKFDISGAHNGYLDIILELGFGGLFLYAMFLLGSASKGQKMLGEESDWGILWTCYLLMATVHNITESSLNTLTFPMTAVILFLTVSSTEVISGTREAPKSAAKAFG
jgi:O-antigen ligase